MLAKPRHVKRVGAPGARRCGLSFHRSFPQSSIPKPDRRTTPAVATPPYVVQPPQRGRRLPWGIGHNLRVAGEAPLRVRKQLERRIHEYPHRLVRAIDYLVVTRDDADDRRPAGHDGPVELPHEVRIERVESDFAERIFAATSLRGEDWQPGRLFHAVDAYVRESWNEGEETDPLDTWDDERRIWPVVQLSRLIRDNSTSTEHAAQLQIRSDGSERIVPFDGFESHVVYRLYPDRSGWLDVREAIELRTLVEAYWGGPPLPDRVRRALRQTEAIMGERYLEYALPLVVGGFESILKIGRDFAKAQFSQRVPALAIEVGVQLSVRECEDVYDDRSALVHGAGVDLTQPPRETSSVAGSTPCRRRFAV